MHLGALSTVYLDRPLGEAARRLSQLGLRSVEFGAGGYFPKNHCDPGALLQDPRALDEFRQTLSDCGLTISALALHGEPLHADPLVVKTYDGEFRSACQLARQVGVSRLTLTAGLPPGAPGDQTPNWILFPWPPRMVDCYRWQWEQKVLPYWKEQAKFAADCGVRLCFEMVPGDMVYNPETLLRLRDAVGPTVGCNFDPSHLFWQGIDVLDAIHRLGSAIYHVHAKDTSLLSHNVRVNGVLDPKPFQQVANRSWLFRTVGYGHDESFWRDFASTLRLVGYDDVLSIEHEDPLIDLEEGLESAIRLLEGVVIRKPPAKLWSD